MNTPDPAETNPPAESNPSAERDGREAIVDDVLLLLFQPKSGAIAGETTLFYVLGAAVVAELSMQGLLTASGAPAHTVGAQGAAPSDPVLRRAWEYVSDKPRDPHTIISVVGPELRAQVLDRLEAQGHLEQTKRKMLGFIPSTSISVTSDRRTVLLESVRRALVEGEEPDERTAVIAALLSASANLHAFDPEIPYTSAVIERARQFEQGNWGAVAASTAVTLSTIAVLTGALSAASAAQPR